MGDEPIRGLEFDRAIASVNANIDALRSEMNNVREDLGARIDRLEARGEESLAQKLSAATESGRMQGRLESIEHRLDRHDSWKIATVGAAIAALGAIAFELVRK
jgi:hypothetical protein